jgi:hypothetical protein
MAKQPETSMAEQALGAIMFCAKEYKVKFTIENGSDSTYASSRHILNDGTSMWRIQVMTRKFVDVDFIKCAQEACKFVMNAHEPNKIP